MNVISINKMLRAGVRFKTKDGLCEYLVLCKGPEIIQLKVLNHIWREVGSEFSFLYYSDSDLKECVLGENREILLEDLI